MISPDMINAGFEVFGTVGVLVNCRAVFRDKRWAGLSPSVSFGFCLWGFWNIFYYGDLQQPFSVVASVGVACANSLYLYMLWVYRDKAANSDSAVGAGAEV